MRTLTVCLMISLSDAALSAVVMDRVAVVVGRRVVKTSDIDRDLRSSQLLNRQPLDVSDSARRKVADRVIEQELIRQELQSGQYEPPDPGALDTFEDRIRKERFSGDDSQFKAALMKYGLSREQFREYLRYQLAVLRFIDERFRPAVLVTDEEVRAFYEKNKAELTRANTGSDTLEALEPKIRELITGQRVNDLFEEWLNQTRRQARIEYRPEAFGGGESKQ